MDGIGRNQGWHNHLNPGINKEVWTQEEEIRLIHAHQTYGNKWVELSKFLPGRSARAIQKHWCNSVKKKVDSYRASGLLGQFQGLAPLDYPAGSLNIDSSSAMTHENSQDSSFNVIMEVQDSTELSQSSFTKVSCSQEEEACYIYTENVDSALPEMHHQLSTSDIDQDQHIQQEFSQGSDIGELQNDSALTDSQVADEVAGQCQYTPAICGSDNHGGSLIPYVLPPGVPIPVLPVTGYEQNASTMCEVDINNEEHLLSELWQDISFESLVFATDPIGSNYCSSPNYEPGSYSSDAANNFSAELYPLQTLNSSRMVDPVYYQNSVPSVPVTTYSDGAWNASDVNFETSTLPVFHQDFGLNSCQNASGHPSQPSYLGTGDEGYDIPNPMDNTPESGKKLLADVERSSAGPITSIGKDKSSNHGETAVGERENAGDLCYELPCFPSFEVPFVSGDLIASSDDPEYSPLGIRQLMRPSLPVRLWSSPV
ncbi:hypothetical protein ACP4OV_016408 [Aristida adscensionis]